MLDAALWWTGATAWAAALGFLAWVVLLVAAHAWRTSIFVARIWRVSDHTRKLRRVPAVWWQSFTEPPDRAHLNGRTVHWPGKEEADV